jgi:hypothetical protein
MIQFKKFQNLRNKFMMYLREIWWIIFFLIFLFILFYFFTGNKLWKILEDLQYPCDGIWTQTKYNLDADVNVMSARSAASLLANWVSQT